MDNITKSQIISLIHQEVIPAIGCTEPVAVALAAAKSYRGIGRTSGKDRRITQCQYPEECNGSGDTRNRNGGIAYRDRSRNTDR